MGNRWDVQGLASHGDQSEEVLYAAVGRALSLWEELEEDLADLFAGFVGSEKRVHSSSNPACRAYGSIPNFSSRADMLSAAAEAFFENFSHPALRSRYRETIKQCREFSARRNEIAHGTLHYDSELGCFLRPAYYNSRKFPDDHSPAYQYASKEIHYYAEQFILLTEAIRELEKLVYDARQNS
jgi:hypothetical protein